MRYGFTLVEVLIAMVIFLVGVLGILPLLLANIKYNESVQKMQIAQKILESVSSELRSIKVYYFEKAKLKDLGFRETPPSGYPAVSDSCPPGYEYAVFKGVSVNKTVDNTSVTYTFTVKLCVDDDYLKPYLKRTKVWVYWMYRGKEHKLGDEIYITAK